jgi:hypothetical protein
MENMYKNDVVASKNLNNKLVNTIKYIVVNPECLKC